MTRQPDDIEFVVRRAGDDPFGDKELRSTQGFTSQDIVNAISDVRNGRYAASTAAPISALDHGVVGDGSTPEGAAVQAFLNAYAGKAVRFPSPPGGAYVIDQTITVPVSTTIHFDNVRWKTTVQNAAALRPSHSVKTLGLLEIDGSIAAAVLTNKALTANVATLTTQAAHGFTVGQTVRVGSADAVFNGVFTVASVPSSTSFTYALVHADVVSAATSGTAWTEIVGAVGLEYEGSVSWSDLDAIYIHNCNGIGNRWHNAGVSGGHYYNDIRYLRIANCTNALSVVTDAGLGRINANHVGHAIINGCSTSGLVINNADHSIEFDYLDIEATKGDAINLIACQGFNAKSGWIEGNTVSLRIANDPAVRFVDVSGMNFDSSLTSADTKLVYTFNRSRSIALPGQVLGNKGFEAVSVGQYGQASDDQNGALDAVRIAGGLRFYRLSAGNPYCYLDLNHATVGLKVRNNAGGATLFTVETDGTFKPVGYTLDPNGNVYVPITSMSWRHDIDVFPTPLARVGTWTVVVDAGCIYAGRLASDGAQNDSIDFTVSLAPGTWTVELMHTTNTDKGIYTVQLDDGAGTFTTLGTIDGYTASIARNVLTALTGLVVGGTVPIKRSLRLLMATKNASSSSYVANLQHVTLKRTA